MNSSPERVEGIGISEDLPENVSYFQEICIMEDLIVPFQKPDIESVLSVMVNAEVIDYKLIKTPVSLSYEGQNLSGEKLIVELRINQKVKYVSDSSYQSIHAFHSTDTLKSLFIVVPCEVNGEKMFDIIRKRKFSVTPYIEDIYSIKFNCRKVTNYISLIVNVEFY